MSNITPQNAQVNATVWNEIEQRERSLAFKFQSVEVLNLILYGKNPKLLKMALLYRVLMLRLSKLLGLKNVMKYPITISRAKKSMIIKFLAIN